MKGRSGEGMTILRIVISVVLFSIFLKADSILHTVDIFVSWGWSLPLILFTIVLIRMIFAGLVVLAVLPHSLGWTGSRDWLPRYLRMDRKIVLLGFLSFVVFCVLATVISLGMGIFKGDLSTVFAYPDIRPDPDVIGWGYFLLALIPGIWEELAFRGLVQSKLQKAFSPTVSVLLSAVFFGLFHFSNIVTQAPSQVVLGAIMAFFFGIGWGFLTVRARSVIPAMLSHYFVDSTGQIFLTVDHANPALMAGFLLLLTLAFPVFNVILAQRMYKE